jgi:uncharacterized membrane protein YagU involved in acid resistance
VIETISPATYHRSETLRAAVLGGFVAGALRIIYAFATAAADDQNPLWVLQSIASGLLGVNAFNGGLVSGALGAIFHFGIAIVAAGIYIAASRRLDFLNRFPIPSGLLYGATVYTFMNYVVVPLSDFTFKNAYSTTELAGSLIAHMLLVGVPIALAARWRGRY